MRRSRFPALGVRLARAVPLMFGPNRKTPERTTIRAFDHTREFTPFRTCDSSCSEADEYNAFGPLRPETPSGGPGIGHLSGS